MQPASLKYIPFKPVTLTSRAWPSARITRAPLWCSTDLRDGNQALVEPMNLEEKLKMFETLVGIGFKEIEVSFPSASQVEYDFTRALIEQYRIPEDVTIQVLTPAREHLIRRTFESLEGASHAIVHLYINASPFFRQVVYKAGRRGVIEMAEAGARLMVELAKARPDGGAGIRFEFSPESFSVTVTD